MTDRAMAAEARILENPSKRLRSPRPGDLAALEYLEESTPRVRRLGAALLNAYELGRGGASLRLRNQRRELRRLNRVIQQMSWKLHRKTRPLIQAATSGLVVGLIVGALAGIMAVLVFS